MEPDAVGQPERTSWFRTNQGIGVCLVVLFVVLLAYLASEDWVYTKLRDGFHLGTFTVASTVIMLLCSFAFIVDRHRNATDKEMQEAHAVDFVVAVGAGLGCLAYFYLAWNVDFLAITPVFLCAAMFFLGVRPFRTAVIAAIITTVVIFILFYLLGIDLPSFITPA